MSKVELISVDDLKHTLSCDCNDSACENCEWYSLQGECECRWSLKELKQKISELPTVDHVKHGQWHAFTPIAQTRYVCSECFATGKYHIWSDVDGLNYCPRCGAKMEEVSE